MERKRVKTISIGLALLLLWTSFFVPVLAVSDNDFSVSDNSIDDRQMDIVDYVPQYFQDRQLRSFSNDSYPARYDGREQNKATAVRNQYATEACWAFATIGAMEMSAIMDGANPSKVDFSEEAFAYFYYNKPNDPLHGTSGDVTGTESGYDYLSNGGNLYSSIYSLSAWNGAGAENLAPFRGVAGTVNPSVAWQNQYIMKEAYMISSEKDYIIADTKDAVSKYGAVAFMFQYDSRYFNSNTAAYYYPGSGANHAAVIVGWDDTYSKEKFVLGRQPKNDGAWIVKNSYGTDWGDQGYLYISYEDASLCYLLALEAVPSYTYRYNYQYDGGTALSILRVANGTEFANVFTVQGCEEGKKEILKAVQFAVSDVNVTYEIQIYKNIADENNPTSGEAVFLEKMSGRTERAGIYTVDLSEEITLMHGETYSIVITFRREGFLSYELFVERGVQYTYQSENKSIVWLDCQSNSEAGQSFERAPDSIGWNDLHEEGMTARIKAFTINEEERDTVYENPLAGETNEPEGNSNENAANSNENANPVISLSQTKVAAIKSQTYTGKNIKPAVKLSYSGKTLKKNTDYTVSYKNNKKTGKATATLIGKGQYKGTKKATFFIVPKKVTISLAKPIGKRKIKVTWKKNNTADGYKIYYSTDKKFKKNVKTSLIKKKKVTTKTIANLKKGKYYYIRMRAYKTIDKKKRYGSYGKIVRIKVK